MFELVLLCLLAANPGANVYVDGGAIHVDHQNGSPVYAYNVEQISKDPPFIDLTESEAP